LRLSGFAAAPVFVCVRPGEHRRRAPPNFDADASAADFFFDLHGGLC